MHGETISSGVVAPCGGKYTGTAVALKSGNSCIRRVRMIIPAVPFFDFTTNTIYAAVLRSVQAYGNSDEKDGYCGKAGKHGKIDPVGTDEIDPVKTA